MLPNTHLSYQNMIRFRIVDAVHFKMMVFNVLFCCFKLRVNLIPPLLLWDLKIGETNYFSSWQVSSIIPLEKSLSISPLIKLISSSENWDDMTLCCVLEHQQIQFCHQRLLIKCLCHLSIFSTVLYASKVDQLWNY